MRRSPLAQKYEITQEDIQKIEAYKETWLFPYLMLSTGMRRGEALALTYGDIGREHDTISVTKSVLYQNDGSPRIDGVKRVRDNRTVRISDGVEALIPDGPDKQCFLFSVDDGRNPLTRYQFDRLWRQFKNSTGVSCNAHQLRHAYKDRLKD